MSCGIASQASEANGLQEPLAGDQLRGNGCHKPDHGQASVQFLGTRVEAPSGLWAGESHGRFPCVDVVVAFTIVGDQAGVGLNCGGRHGGLREGPGRSMAPRHPREGGQPTIAVRFQDLCCWASQEPIQRGM